MRSDPVNSRNFPLVGSCFTTRPKRKQKRAIYIHLQTRCHDVVIPRPSKASWCNPMSWDTFTIRRYCEDNKNKHPGNGPGSQSSSVSFFFFEISRFNGFPISIIFPHFWGAPCWIYQLSMAVRDSRASMKIDFLSEKLLHLTGFCKKTAIFSGFQT